MNKYPEAIKKILTSLIEEMAVVTDSFCQKPREGFHS